jgi:hypothetical protein
LDLQQRNRTLGLFAICFLAKPTPMVVDPERFYRSGEKGAYHYFFFCAFAFFGPFCGNSLPEKDSRKKAQKSQKVMFTSSLLQENVAGKTRSVGLAMQIPQIMLSHQPVHRSESCTQNSANART